MYGRRAEYYDPIYDWRDHAAESRAIRARLGAAGIRDRRSVGCNHAEVEGTNVLRESVEAVVGERD
jgi:hypothetical protein